LVSRKNPLSSCSLSSSVKMGKNSFFIGCLWVLQLSRIKIQMESVSHDTLLETCINSDFVPDNLWCWLNVKDFKKHKIP
jgi:hypothetical protein